MNATTQFTDIDSILDATLDDLADAPEFKPFPAGSHQCTFTLVQKMINAKPVFEWKLTAIETLELADPANSVNVKAGDTCSSSIFMYDKEGKLSEMAQGQFKDLLRPFQAHFNTASNRETLEAAQNTTVVVTMSQRAGKAGSTSEGRFFPVIDALVVV